MIYALLGIAALLVTAVIFTIVEDKDRQKHLSKMDLIDLRMAAWDCPVSDSDYARELKRRGFDQ